MKDFMFVILLMLVANPIVNAAPTESDRQRALELMYTVVSDQELHFKETSNYESVDAHWNEGLIYQACAYSNFNGKGFVATVTKIENGKVYNIERHFGDDVTVESKIDGVWTCKNCNGESYDFRKQVNEHRFCDL